MGATVSTVYPAFLIGALAVQVSDDFSVSESAYGWGIGGFFLAATVGSALLGRVAQWVGPRRQILTALVVTAGAELFIAAGASGWYQLVAALALCGLVNAGNQTAVNLALTEAEIPRLGLAIALKQSGMPTAALLSGLMVPGLALTVGWRWAYVFGAGLALFTAAVVRRVITPRPAIPDWNRRRHPMRQPERPTPARPGSTRIDLWIAATVGAFLSFAAGSLNAWIVSSGVDAGLGEATAGIMLSLGAGSGIALRIYAGSRLDQTDVPPFLIAGLMVLAGALGLAALTVRSPGFHALATMLAFAGGWIWPVFTNYGIVRTNPNAAASVTGLTQMGVYVGVFSAPLVTGWIIEHHGYQPMWLTTAAMMMVGSVLALSVRNRF